MTDDLIRKCFFFFFFFFFLLKFIFLQFSIKIYVVIHAETILMSTHNTSFYREMYKLNFFYKSIYFGREKLITSHSKERILNKKYSF